MKSQNAAAVVISLLSLGKLASGHSFSALMVLMSFLLLQQGLTAATRRRTTGAESARALMIHALVA
jgi:thiamine transporter ThiT